MFFSDFFFLASSYGVDMGQLWGEPYPLGLFPTLDLMRKGMKMIDFPKTHLYIFPLESKTSGFRLSLKNRPFCHNYDTLCHEKA